MATFFYIVSALAFANACRLIYRKRADEAAERAYIAHMKARDESTPLVDRIGHKRAGERRWRDRETA